MRSANFAALGLAAYAVVAPTHAVAETSLKVLDIEVSAQHADMNILVTLNGQPKAAQVRSNRKGLVLTLNGLQIDPFEIHRPDAPHIKRAKAKPTKSGASITFEGRKVTHAETVLYKNAVLIRTRLSKPIPPQPKMVAPAASPAPPTPHTATNITIATVANLTKTSCKTAENSIAANPWDLDKLGDHILCLLDADQPDAAKPQLEQLSAFAPDDWRVSFATAEILRSDGKDSEAQIAYSNALNLVQAPPIRTRLTARLTAYQAELKAR